MGEDEGRGVSVAVDVFLGVTVGVKVDVDVGVFVTVAVGVMVKVGSGWVGIEFVTRKNIDKPKSKSANNHPAIDIVSLGRKDLLM